MARHLPARLTLLLGVLALGLVVLPAIIFDQPLPWSLAAREKDQPLERPAPPPTAHRFNIRINKFEFAFGKSTSQPATAATEVAAPPPPLPPRPSNPVKPYQISAVILALAGLITGPLAWTSARRSRPLVVSGVTCCCAAILWHYVVAGLIVGVAVAILLFILSALG
jgi:hypothetical protein